MKEKLKEFFETELVYAKMGFDQTKNPKHRNDICWNARQRGLGAVDLAQLCGLDYETAEKMFYQYCNELEAMEYKDGE